MCGEHFVADDSESLGLHIGLAPVAADVRCGTTSTDGEGHAVVERLRIARGTGYGP